MEDSLLGASRRGLLAHKRAPIVRMALICIQLLNMFAVGGAYYSFPMWLEFIVADIVELSSDDIMVLGGTLYVTLGLFGILCVMANRANLGRTREFLLMSIFGVISNIVGALIVIIVVWSPQLISNPYAAMLVAMVLFGLGTGQFYFIWFAKIGDVVNPKYIVLVYSSYHICFPFGALCFLALRYAMHSKPWILFTFSVLILVMIADAIFALYFYDSILLNESEQQNANATKAKDAAKAKQDAEEGVEVAIAEPVDSANPAQPASSGTSRMLLDQLLWRRQLSKHQLALERTDVSSSQFYLMMLNYLIVMGMSVTFMVNLGPLTSNEISSSFNAQLTVFMASSAANVIGRIFVSVYSRYREQGEQLSSEDPKVKSLAMSRHLNRIVPNITIAIAAIYFFGIIILRFAHIPFILASSILSIGYGAMWNVTGLFPNYFDKYNFSVILSVFQIVGSIGQIMCVAISAGSDFSNDQIFTMLLLLSILNLAVAILLKIDRTMTELTPKEHRAMLTTPLDQVVRDERMKRNSDNRHL